MKYFRNESVSSGSRCSPSQRQESHRTVLLYEPEPNWLQRWVHSQRFWKAALGFCWNLLGREHPPVREANNPEKISKCPPWLKARALFVLQRSPLCTSCSRPCLPVFAGCGCTRAAGGGWRNTDLGRVWCKSHRSLGLLPRCTPLPSGGSLTSQPSRMGCSSRGGQH